MDPKSIDKAILGFVLLIVLFKVYASMLPEGQSAGDELCATGAPLTSLFSSNGVVWVLIVAGLVILVVRTYTRNK